MCGIVGFTLPGPDAAAVAKRMADSLAHRGPDAEGFHIGSGVALGHRRLTVIDPAGGAQPRIDPKTGDALVYNGEIYGYRDFAEDLRAQGIPLCDNSDTEVLFQAVRHLGLERTLERIDGMFAFAYVDGASGAVTLVRDRFGEKPLYWAVVGGALIFASEVKALLHHPALTGAPLDPVAVDRFLAFEFLPGRDSGFAGIQKLEPATWMRFRDGIVETRRYWWMRYPRSFEGTLDDAADELDRLLTDSVRRRLIADVPVGVFMSGGVDSSLVAAVAAKESPHIKAYTIGMVDASFDETGYAEAVARHCGLRHVVHRFDAADVTASFERLAPMFDELVADYSFLPTHFLCERTQRDETVALGGDGADELFAGYSTFRARRFSAVMRHVPAAVGTAVRRLLRALPSSEAYMNPGSVLQQVSVGFGHSADHQALSWLAPFGPEERDALWRREFRPPQDGLFAEVDAILARQQDGLSAAERIVDLFTNSYLPDDILIKVDRCAMAVSLETREPYLDRGFAEVAFSLPVAWKTRAGDTKVVLKHLAGRYLPEGVVKRSKQGFGFSMGRFLRGALAGPVRDRILDSGNPAAAWFHRAELERILAEHASGRFDHRKKVWALFVLFSTAARAGGSN